MSITATKKAAKKGAVAAKREAWDRQRQGVDVRESLDLQTSAGNVDHANGIIHRVKVLSKSSPNRHGMNGVSGTNYEPEAHRQLEGILKNGVEVNVGHPPKDQPDQERPPEARNGRLYNPIVINGETYADWKLLKSHPMTARILESASDPELHDQFALSINARAYGVPRNGRYCVTEFLPTPSSPEKFIRSVDLVTRGGANRNIFESQEGTMKKPFKEIVAAASAKVQAWWKRVGERAKAADVLEMYEDMGDMAAEAPAVADEVEAGWEEHCAEMVKAIMMDDALDVDAKAKKIAHAIKLLKDEEEETEGEVGAEVAEDDGAAADEEKKEAMENAELAELKQLRDEKNVRELFEAMEVVPDSKQIKAVMKLPMIDRVREINKIKKDKKTITHPRTSSGRDVYESRQTASLPSYDDTTEEARKKRIAALRR